MKLIKRLRSRESRHRLQLCVEPLEQLLLLSGVQGGTPDYYGGDPNWAFSPQPTIDASGNVTGGIRKFVDSLPGLGAANANNLGQFIPVAIPDTKSYPGSDYYEIEVGQYTERMSSSLNPTTLRGYRQTNTTDPTVSKFNYLGPMIMAQKDRPVRIKFTNSLPTGSGGDLFLPTDTSVDGAGAGPFMIHDTVSAGPSPGVSDPTQITIQTATPHGLDAGQLLSLSGFSPTAYNGEFRITSVPDPTHLTLSLRTIPSSAATVLGMLSESFTQNRATLHLHGGNTVWISDGTQHQWITPAGENTTYPAGVSVSNVPDMPDPGPGSMTFYYSNSQSARLLWAHDHALGITRLNVYAGEALGYLQTDAVEQDLISKGILPDLGTPLIIQDKTFIDPNTVLKTDPTWQFPVDPNLSNLWTPHVYMPNQNPNVTDGTNPMGRWDYGPFFWPPWPTTYAPIHGISDVTITDGGSGYTLPPIVQITAAEGDTGTGASAVARISPDGVVTEIAVSNRGNGYNKPPIITIKRAPGDTVGLGAKATAEAWLIPNLPDNSMTMESFQDTPVVNGTLYPYLNVEPQAYRYRVLNAADDRSWNLQLYTSSTIVSTITIRDGGSGYKSPPSVLITPAPGDTTGMGATAKANIDPITGAVTSLSIITVGSGYTLAPIVTISPPTTPGGRGATATATIYTGQSEVGMVPAVPGAADFPQAWTVQTIGQAGDILDSR